MTMLDPFSAQIVQLVRNMPDEAILELVRNKLGSVQGITPGPAAVRAPIKTAKAKPAPAPAKARPVAKKRRKATRTKRGPSPQRAELLSSVEKAVKTNKGLSASEVAKATNMPQPRVATALRELKLAKRIFQGGDRRFARYAGDAKTAASASNHARKNAGGPAKKKTRKK